MSTVPLPVKMADITASLISVALAKRERAEPEGLDMRGAADRRHIIHLEDN